MAGYDPLHLGKSIEKCVIDGDKRKYTQLGRPVRFYHGSTSASAVGCSLTCKFCWADRNVFKPGKTGRFYSPEEVFNGLTQWAARHNHRVISVSGGEGTLGREHLLSLLHHVRSTTHYFVCESNGMALGSDASYVKDLTQFPDHLHVRLSLKESCPEDFHRVTGARPEAYELPYQAIQSLIDAEVSVSVCLVASFSSEQNIQDAISRLAAIHPGILKSLELETIKIFPSVKKRLEKAGLNPRRIRHRGQLLQLERQQ